MLATVINVGAQYAVIYGEIAVACPSSDLCRLHRHATNINFFTCQFRYLNYEISFIFFTSFLTRYLFFYCNFLSFRPRSSLAGRDDEYYYYFSFTSRLCIVSGYGGGLCLWPFECPEYFFVGHHGDSQCPKIAVA